MGVDAGWTTFSSSGCGGRSKYEEVYLKDYASVREARTGIESYFRFYNQERLHQSLDYRTPAALYRGGA